MAIKTFNVEESVYDKFHEFCRSHGMSMSKQVEMFMTTVVDTNPKAKDEYIQKLQRIRSGKFLKVADFSERYGL